MTEPYIWQMVKEAAENLDGEEITNKQIQDYIIDNFGSVSINTINPTITSCSVNKQSRVNYPENKKSRICNGKYDFLYNTGHGKVQLYNRQKHGFWVIDDKGCVKNIFLPKPSPDEVEFYLTRWDNSENFILQDEALNKLFLTTYKNNTLIEDVLIKVSALNDFYSTNIYSVFPVAQHIVDLNIDERLSKGDPDLVNEIARVELSNGKITNFYSFATKYYSHHRTDKDNGNDYAIYDSYVDKVLKHYRNTDKFCNFNNKDLKDYPSFKNILLKFREFYKLEDCCSLKELDRYLWQLGKDRFMKDYSKKELG